MSLDQMAIDVGGQRRSYLLSAPTGPARSVLFSMHGTTSKAFNQARYSQMGTLAASGVAVVFPQAIVPRGRGFEWDDTFDMPYLGALVHEMLQRFAPESGRVSMTGLSGGARMACRFAWEHSGLVQSVGAVAGLRAMDGAPGRPVPILAFHGTADRINPYRGSGTERWGESVEDSARRWAAANGVGPDAVKTESSPTLVRTTYGQVGAPGEVTLWTSVGAGHTWPGATPGLLLRLILGRTSKEIDATARIAEFADAHAGDP